MTRETRDERQARTVADVLEAAWGEFSERGYHGVTVESIAARAGYTRGAVYGNFPRGKPDVFLAVAHARAERYVDEINAALASADGATIAEVYVRVRALARALPGWGRAVVEFGLVAADDAELRDRFAALRRATIERVRSGLEMLEPAASFSAQEMAVVVVSLESGLDLLRWVDPALVSDDLEFRVVERLGGWEVEPVDER